MLFFVHLCLYAPEVCCRYFSRRPPVPGGVIFWWYLWNAPLAFKSLCLYFFFFVTSEQKGVEEFVCNVWFKDVILSDVCVSVWIRPFAPISTLHAMSVSLRW